MEMKATTTSPPRRRRLIRITLPGVTAARSSPRTRGFLFAALALWKARRTIEEKIEKIKKDVTEYFSKGFLPRGVSGGWVFRLRAAYSPAFPS
jgi:hypothetical protein